VFYSVCYSVSQCVAVCCSEVPPHLTYMRHATCVAVCVTVCCSVLQCVAVFCSVCYSLLQCSVLQCVAVYYRRIIASICVMPHVLQYVALCVAVCYGALQCGTVYVAVCASSGVLQCFTATSSCLYVSCHECGSVLQCVFQFGVVTCSVCCNMRCGVLQCASV